MDAIIKFKENQALRRNEYGKMIGNFPIFATSFPIMKFILIIHTIGTLN
jgi:hypothetical protein